jgi:integrase/recombinase XerD
MTFETLTAAYLAQREADGLSAVTRDLVARWLGGFARWCREHQVATPRELTREHLEEYRNALCWSTHRGGFYSPNSVDQALRMVRACLRWGVDRGWLPQDPTRQWVLGVPIQPRQRVLTRDQVEALLNAPDPGTALGLRNRALLSLFYHLPVSARQASELDVEHVQLPGWLEVPGPDGPVRHELDGSLAERLGRYLSGARLRLTLEERPLWVSRTGVRMTLAGLQKLVAQQGLVAGLGRGLCPRTLHRSFRAHLREFREGRHSLS